jgi:hypothetical protein
LNQRWSVPIRGPISNTSNAPRRLAVGAHGVTVHLALLKFQAPRGLVGDDEDDPVDVGKSRPKRVELPVAVVAHERGAARLAFLEAERPGPEDLLGRRVDAHRRSEASFLERALPDVARHDRGARRERVQHRAERLRRFDDDRVRIGRRYGEGLSVERDAVALRAFCDRVVDRSKREEDVVRREGRAIRPLDAAPQRERPPAPVRRRFPRRRESREILETRAVQLDEIVEDAVRDLRRVRLGCHQRIERLRLGDGACDDRSAALARSDRRDDGCVLRAMIVGEGVLREHDGALVAEHAREKQAHSGRPRREDGKNDDRGDGNDRAGHGAERTHAAGA